MVQLDIEFYSSGITYKSFQVLSPSVVTVWGQYRSKGRKGGQEFHVLGGGGLYTWRREGGREEGERREREKREREGGGRSGPIKTAVGCKKRGEGRAYGRLVKMT